MNRLNLALTLRNCQVEEDVVKHDGSINTVRLDEAISFMKQNPIKDSSIKAIVTPILLDLEHLYCYKRPHCF
jgi:hypothetical protein